MKKSNQRRIEKHFEGLAHLDVRFRVIDDRWKRGGDVDMIVHRKDFKTARKYLIDEGFSEIGGYSFYGRAYKRKSEGETLNIGIHIGGYTNALGLRSRRLVRLFEPRSVPKRSPYLRAEEQIVIILFKVASRSLYSDRRIHVLKFADKFSQLQNRRIDRSYLSALCKEIFEKPSTVARRVCTGIALEDIVVSLRWNHELRARLTRNVRVALRTCYKLFVPATYIAVIGTDGSGKSTMCAAIESEFQKHKLRVGVVYHGRSKAQIIPVGKVAKKVRKKKDIAPGTRVVKSSVGRMMVSCYFFVEYGLRYISRVLPARLSYDVVISDRSFIDILVSPNTDRTLSRLFLHLMPTPKYVFLWAAPEVAAKRANHPQKDVARQLKIYRGLSKRFDVTIRTDAEPAESGAKRIVDTIKVR